MRSNIEAFHPRTHQKKAYTGTAGTIDDAVSAQARVVRVVVTTDAYIAISKAPTATTSDVYMPADTPEYFLIGAGEKVSAIQESSGGDLHVTEMTR